MDQVKIGKFIADVRKEQKMTQLELANKIGVTDRAVSKWENGRGLPDLSLIKPLCEALSISVNEFFCGEHIPQDRFIEKAEETIIDTLSYSEKRALKFKRILLSLLIGAISMLVLITVFFSVDLSRMKQNKPVLFSTWGFDYCPPVNLDDEHIKLAISDYLVSHGDREEKHEKSVKTFAAVHTYLLEETVAGTQYNVYTWVLQEQYYLDINCITQYGSFSAPFKFVVEKTVDGFAVSDSRTPRDGTYYAEDMKNLFPKDVIKKMDNFHRDGTYERLKLEIDEYVKLYFHQE